MSTNDFLAALARLGVDPGRLAEVVQDAPFGVYVDGPAEGAVYANRASLATFQLAWDELADGELHIASQPGTGTAVTIRLPIVAPAEAVARPARPVPALTPCHVILVEDNDAMRQALGYALAIRGHHVRVARNLADARALLAEDRPLDVYITDALLPDGNAIDLVTGVRRTRPDVSVIVASGFMGDAGSSPALEDACVVCLRKPFGHAQLLDAMQRARASV